MDVDIKPGKDGEAALKALEAIHGQLPQTPISQTGSGGYHLLYAYPANTHVKSGANVAGLGLDIRAAGGYIVAPPSRHESGNDYKWLTEPNGHPAPEAPAWVYAKATKPAGAITQEIRPERTSPPASQAILDAARARLARHGPAIEGQGGDEHTYRAAAILRNDYGLSIDQAFPLFAEWNTTCQPSWDGDMLDAKLRRSLQYATRPYGCERDALEVAAALAPVEETPEGWSPTFVDLVNKAKADLGAILGDKSRGSARDLGGLISFGDARKIPWAGTSWLIESVFQQNSLGQVVAGSKTGKTWLVLDMALSIVTGLPLFNKFPVRKTGRVLLWLTEDQMADAVNRIDALIAAKQMPHETIDLLEKNLYLKNMQKFDVENDGELAQIVAKCWELAPLDMVVFDPLRNVSDAEEKDSTAMKAVLDRFIAVKQLTNSSVLYTHHTTKPTPSAIDDPRSAGDRGRGSTHITAAVDATIGYVSCDKKSEDNTIVTTMDVDLKNAKSAGMFSLRLHIEGTADRATEAWYTYSKADLDKDPKKTLEHSNLIREYLAKKWEDGLKEFFPMNTLIAELKIGKDKRRVSGLIDRLVDSGVIERGQSSRGVRHKAGSEGIVLGGVANNFLEEDK